jgi:DNA-binding transcriptional ArsR family regulator
MAIRIQLDRADLARVRFGVSPVYETIAALCVLDNPGAHAMHLPWVRWATPRVPDGPDVRLLRRLLSGPAIPVAFAPAPDSRMPELSTELARVRRANLDRLDRSLDAIYGSPRWLAPVRADLSAGLARVVDALRACHDALIAPHWTRMRALLEADITHRLRRLGDAGIADLLGRLHPDVHWSPEGEVTVRCDWGPGIPVPVTVTVNGHGLVLCPSIFTWPHVLTAARATGTAAALRYPARGAGTLWERHARPHDGLDALLGRTRARILALLDEPRGTPELAAKLDVTPGAVSQHLAVLRAAGLVASQRDGRGALHLRTARADALLAPPDRAGNVGG